ncbi:uncharacterized protein LOC121878736 [Homarus americanus]|uniref:Putative Alcohol dehydrogenase transcription factor Myb/SANT-like-containing protein 18 n=1 Tax=Homarus americanus TaxID=6706 RepID=A0A8J5JPL8_HOMAM|nr:uncharacterized protein LOC121878736 [Homarus americanus]XP_042241026.1 uncharacterized protein LOC121878736 [Homarus americanus]KAG7158458.1 putative Alcohol dehydrogenase transcription factor Myb/SANT-like-containing protein 18 [Homarus americanus]
MKMRWNYRTESTLIKLIRERRILWDSTNEYYSRKSLKKQEYDEIAQQLLQEFPDIPPHAMTGDAVRVKFNHLREYFRRLLKRVQVKENGAFVGEELVPEWEHFTSLLFLNDTTSNQYTLVSNLPKFKSLSEASVEDFDNAGSKETRGIGLYIGEEEEDSSYLSKILTPITQLSTENCELFQTPAELERCSPTAATVPEQDTSHYLNSVHFKPGIESSLVPSCTKSYSAKKKRKRISPQDSEEALNISLACLHKITEKKEDQYDHFGKFVASAIRSLPEGNRWPVMTNIWQVLDMTIEKE